MKGLRKTQVTILAAFALIGLITGVIFTFRFAKERPLSSNANLELSLAVSPLPTITQVDTPFPTYTSVPTPTPTPTPIVLKNGWYLYVDEQAGYSFSYPPDILLQTSKEGGLTYTTVHIQFRIPDAGYQGMSIKVLSNPQDLPIENIVQEIYTTRDRKPSLADIQDSIEPLTIGKLSAFKSVFQPFLFEFSIFIPYDDKVIFAVPVTRMGLMAFDPRALELFEAILATLTLDSGNVIVFDNDWHLYTDPDGEFSFAYPPTALINTGQNPVDLSKNITLQFQLSDKPYQGMSIRLEPNPDRLSGSDIAIQLLKKSAQKPVTAEFTDSLQQISVGGLSAVQVYISSTNTEVTVIIPYGDKVFIVSPVHDSAMTKVKKEILELFYQILGTFKFGSI